MKTAKIILSIVLNTLRSMIDVFDLIFEDDMSLMSREAKKIFAHKDDRKKYVDACESILLNGGEITIELHTGEWLTLC